MKKTVLLIALLLSLNFYSQGWKFNSGSSDFDGNYKTSYVVGKGNKFPYNEPLLTINKFEKDETLNFYISGAGFFREGTNARIMLVFSNEPDLIYSSYSISFSSDGKIVFLDTFNDPNSSSLISKYEILEKIKKATKLSVRASDKYGSNDIVFSLRGSTKAVNYVISEEQLISKINKVKEEREKEETEKKLINENVEKLINVAKSEKLGESSTFVLKQSIEDKLNAGKIYTSLLIKPTSNFDMFKNYGYVDVYAVLENGKEEQIYGTFKVEMNSPIFTKIEEEKKLKAEKEKIEKERVYKLLDKFQIGSLKDLMFKSILNKQKNSYLKQWTLNQVKSINGVFSEFKYGKIWNLKIIINLQNGEKVVKDEYIYSLEINKKQLKGIGAKLLQEF